MCIRDRNVTVLVVGLKIPLLVQFPYIFRVSEVEIVNEAPG